MSDKILKIGHRGAKGHLAENTLESIQKALDLGVDGIEIDVHKCASGELIVMHDYTVNRLTDGSGEISKLTLKEIKKLKIKGRYEVPTLAQVLLLIKNRCLLNIELKGKDTAKEACRLLDFYVEKKGWEYSNFIISSFQLDLLEAVYKINKKIPIGVLTDTDLDDAVAFAKTVKAVAIHPDHTMLTEENVKKLKEDFKVYTYTVNNLKPIVRIKSYEVDGMISDYPDRL